MASTATVNLNLVDKRMLNASEAASYCGLPAKHFKSICPVRLTSLGPFALYDKHDLDDWIEHEKSGAIGSSMSDILGKLE